MADLTYTLNATPRREAIDAVPGQGYAGALKTQIASIELATSTSVTRTIKLGRVKSTDRLSGASKIYNDDLATTGSPTLDIGLAPVDSNITADADAINDGHALSSASTGANLIKEIANVGKMAWEFTTETSDPGGFFDVYGSVLDAPTTDAGTITTELVTFQD